MCGIIGYVGFRKASLVLTEALKRLEYRGYDSVGIAVVDAENSEKSKSPHKLQIRKDKGMIDDVSIALKFTELEGKSGIGHTRWATHGGVCRENSHPHSDCEDQIVLAHNGVIENFSQIKDELLDKGHRFKTETDSEVVAHLIEEGIKQKKKIEKAFSDAIGQLEGSYAIVALYKGDSEERLFVARQNSPLVLGVGEGEMFCASDIPAVLDYTKNFITLEEGDSAILRKDSYEIFDKNGKKVERKIKKIEWKSELAQKNGYEHFMLKEIHEQKQVIKESFASQTEEASELLKGYQHVHVIAAGTSYHAGLLLTYLLNDQGKNAQAFIASDYSFIAKPSADTLLIAISQSGETADVLQALRYAKRNKKIAITNVVDSSITGICDEVVYLHAGPEIGVAATKTFLAQLAIVTKLVLGKKPEGVEKLVETLLGQEHEVKKIAHALVNKENVFFIARGKSVPLAYEGSLKFKEITYIHSEAYPGGELKHGTLSLITEGTPIIALAPSDKTIQKLFGNIKEAKARGGMIISITDNREVERESEYCLKIPKVEEALIPFALIVPLQFLAYYVSVLRGINPDKPRNLAKSITVE